MADATADKDERAAAEGDQQRAGARDPTEADAPAGAAPNGSPAAGGSDQKASWTVFQQYINGTVNAPNAVFGMGAAGGAEPPMFGRLTQAEIAKIAQVYAEPPCYGEALEALRAERVAILTGLPGSGRRAAAITMLDRVKSPQQPVVVLAPGTTLVELAGRTFDEGVGYLMPVLLDTGMTPEAGEFHWDNACRKVREKRAYLVVTTDPGTWIARSATARTITWQRPATEDVLRAQLGAVMVEDATIDEVARVLGRNAPLGKVAETARRLATSDQAKLAELLSDLNGNDVLVVTEWLDKIDAAIPEVLEATALAFMAGTSERIFEDELRVLKGRIAEFAPEVDPANDKARDEIDLRFRQLRKQRAEHPLIDVRQLPVARTAGAIAVRHVDFRGPAYRAGLIDELWQRLDRDFWTGVRRWLHGITVRGHPVLMASAAVGLALLARHAPDEVIEAYLDPWTAEDASLPEQMMAVYVIWRMSMTDDLATLGLQIAMHWATQGTRSQRRAATFAFSGDLGSRFPVDAVRRLTHLADQGEPLAGNAHAQLFATLAEQGADAALVLGELRRRMTRKQDMPSSDRVHDNVADLLSISDPRSGRPAVALFLMANPDRAADVAPLWARTLRRRPWRERAIMALLNALGAIERGQRGPDSQRNPDALTRSLGAAIGAELPPAERTVLRADLLNRNERGGRKDRGPAPYDGQTEVIGNSDPAGLAGPAQSRVSGDLLETFLHACANPNKKELG